VVLYSNAAVGDPPVEKKLFCNQGDCYETQAAGSQKSERKVFVRETNKIACASTGKEWATRANKAPAQWVCVKNEDPNATLVVPSNFVATDTPCYTTVMPPGVTITNLGGVENGCQIDYQKSNSNLAFKVSTIFSQDNYIDTANVIKQRLESEGKRVRSFNTNFVFGGQRAVKIVGTLPDDQTGGSFLENYIVTDTPSMTDSVHPTTIVNFNKIKNNVEAAIATNTNNTVDIVIAQWQWQNLLTQTTTELSVASCFKVTAPSVSTVQNNVCTTSNNAIRLIPNQSAYNIEFGFTAGGNPSLNFRDLANSFKAGYESRGYIIEKRNDNASIDGLTAVTYEAVKPNEPNTRELVIFPDRKNAQNNRFFMRAKTYGPFKFLQDDVLASWKWL